MRSRARFSIKFLQIGVVALVLAACQSQGTAPLAPTPTKPPAPAIAASPTVVSVPAAEVAATAYMEDLKNRDYDKAAAAISDYSLTMLNGTRDNIRAGMDQSDKNGSRTLDYRLLYSRALAPQTALVFMAIKTQMNQDPAQSANVWLALHLENGQWHVNAGPSGTVKLVDDIKLNVAAQTVNEVTVQPVRMIRFTDRVEMLINVTNTSSAKKIVLWGSGNEPFAVFHFNSGTNSVDGSGTGVPFLTGKNYMNTPVNVAGLYVVYPDSIDLLNWQWAGPATPPAPDTSVPKWSYTFKLH